jgi:hypothetical protein
VLRRSLLFSLATWSCCSFPSSRSNERLKTSVTEISRGLLLKAAAYVYYELSNYLSFKDWCVHSPLCVWCLVSKYVLHHLTSAAFILR